MRLDVVILALLLALAGGAIADEAAVPPPPEPTESERDFWAFRPLDAPAPPRTDDAGWPQTPIDLFIRAVQEARGLYPNGPAERRRFVRRASFDLVGLPPEPEDVDAFLADGSPDAGDRLLDRLLASPRHGERWARHWIDVARFAESHGYEQDYDRPHAHHYRDFLIRAFNADLPYDRFVEWQLAGDELAPDDPLAMAATGFLGGGAFPTQLTEAEFESARYDELDDMTSTTGAAFLGISIGCARCHDHKYDPVTMVDYYRLASTFTTAIRSEIDLALEPGSEPVKVQVTSEGFKPTKHHADDRGFPHFYPETHFLERGDVERKRGVAAQGFPRVLVRRGAEDSRWLAEPPPGWTRTSFRRTSLARWLTDVEKGAGNLAARVIVNRLWQHHLGRGIVGTPNDFGAQGERPTHPDLLEWLAAELVRGGWSLKRLHRLIAGSAVYAQSDAHDAARATIDRENTLWWRWTPRRIEGEAVRDAMLAVGGVLDLAMYGPGTLDPDMRRRSVYFFIKRSRLVPVLMLFDWPEHLVSIGRRSVTTVAPQALMFMNSPMARRCAEAFAGRVREAGTVPAASSLAYRLAVGRPPTEIEAGAALEFIAAQAEGYRTAGAGEPERLALTDFCQALLSTNEFIYID